MVLRICEIIVTLDFIFRQVLCSREDVPFNIICLNVLAVIKQFYFLLWFKKTRLEPPFKCDNVKVLIKRKFAKTWSYISLLKIRKWSICYAFWVFSDQTIS